MPQYDSGRYDQGNLYLPPQPLTVIVWTLCALLTLGSVASADKRLDVRKLEEDYVQVLDTLARGHYNAALDALMELEIETLGTTPTVSRIDRVWRHKLAVVRKALELTTPEVLVPVIMLHHDAYDRYREAQKPVLARHARDMATDLATYKAQTTKSAADKEFAGWVMTSFGASVLTMRTSGTSASILRDALTISPTNPVALLGLAWAHEAHGEYDDASKLLEKLVESEPTHSHARLRLAVCQRRQGYTDSAKSNFKQVLAQSTEPWIRSVARQELARTLIEEEQIAAAEEQLRAALEEFPDDQEVAIQLASLVERQGRVAEADRIIAKVSPAPLDKPSARYIYDGRPELEIEAARATMRTMMDERLDVLASGLRWWGAGTAAPDAEQQGEGG